MDWKENPNVWTCIDARSQLGWPDVPLCAGQSRILNTFHASIPLLRWPLDHVFVSRHFHLIDLKRHKLTGSDHFSVTAELALITDEALADKKQSKIKDQSYADEVMTDQNVSEQDVPR